MLSIKFIVREDRGNALKVRLINNRKKVEISVGICLTKEELAKGLDPGSRSKYRSLLFNILQKVEDFRASVVEQGRLKEDAAVLARELAAIIQGGAERPTEDKAPHPGNFAPTFEAFGQSRRAKGTQGVYKHTLDRIRMFDPELGTKDFEDIDLKWLRGFEDFCAKTASVNARAIHLRNIRAVFNYAIDEGLTDAYPFRRFKIAQEATPKRSLGVKQLRRVFDYPCEEYAVEYRDLFKLMFLLIGINCADLWALKEVTPEGRIEFHRAKTHRLYSIKVEPEAMEIVERYRGVGGLLDIADRWSDHRNFRHQMNKALQRFGSLERVGRGGKKVIKAEFPGISTYWARHSWATIAAELDIPDAVISQALGHSSGSVTEIYIRRDQQKVDKANRMVIDWVLYGKKSPWSN